MTLRYVYGAVAMVALVCSVTAGPTSAQARDGGILPPGETGVVTVTGCLLRGNQVQGGQADKYVLANPSISTTACFASRSTSDPSYPRCASSAKGAGSQAWPAGWPQRPEC